MNNRRDPDRVYMSGTRGIIIAIIVTAFVVGTAVYLWQVESSVERPAEAVVPVADVVYLPVYGPDDEWMEPEINFHVAVPVGESLIGQLRILADRLSRFRFEGHPIEVLRIEESRDQRIAVVDLREPEYEGATTWQHGFFQGSTGGQFTTMTLTRTFLQPEYDGEWIDAVEFLYQGEPIEEGDWDHTALYGTITREDVGERLPE